MYGTELPYPRIKHKARRCWAVSGVLASPWLLSGSSGEGEAEDRNYPRLVIHRGRMPKEDKYEMDGSLQEPSGTEP